MPDSIEAVIINHNTSVYAEIALRSLRLIGETASPALNITLLDNHSTDDTGPLREAARELGAQFKLSRWPLATSAGNSHGDVLRDFVLGSPQAQAFLVVESDLCFFERGAVARMAQELEADSRIWAVQARLVSGRRRPSAREYLLQTVNYLRRNREVGLKSALLGPGPDGAVQLVPEGTHWAHIMPRCHPACALLRNDTCLQLIARHIGFSAAWNWSRDRRIGGFSDTLALASQVMTTHGRRFVYSGASIIHFSHGIQRAPTATQMRLLAALRAGNGADVSPLDVLHSQRPGDFFLS